MVDGQDIVKNLVDCSVVSYFLMLAHIIRFVVSLQQNIKCASFIYCSDFAAGC